MTSTEAAGGEVTVTQRLLAAAPSRGEHRALVGGPADPAYGYAELAATVQAAAAGLAWRGLQPRDVMGVYVPDAACYVLAAHAIRAAGGLRARRAGPPGAGGWPRAPTSIPVLPGSRRGAGRSGGARGCGCSPWPPDQSSCRGGRPWPAQAAGTRGASGVVPPGPAQ